MSSWQVLGIEPTSDKKIIKKAYARLLKVTRPDDDPEGFKALYNAYQTALSQAQWIDDDSEYDNEEQPSAGTILPEIAESYQEPVGPSVLDLVISDLQEPQPELVTQKPPVETQLSLRKIDTESTPLEVSLNPPVTHPNTTAYPELLEHTLPLIAANVDSTIPLANEPDTHTEIRFLEDPLEEEWRHLQNWTQQLIQSFAKVNDVKQWEFIQRSPLLMDLEWRSIVSEYVFGAVAKANDMSLEKKHLYIKTPVLEYLNKLLGWELHWRDLSTTFSSSELNAVFDYVNVSESKSYKPDPKLERAIYTSSLTQPWRALYKILYVIRVIVAVYINIMFNVGVALFLINALGGWLVLGYLGLAIYMHYKRGRYFLFFAPGNFLMRIK